MAFNTRKIAVAADTNVQVAGRDFAEVNTAWRTTHVHLQFTPTATPGALQIATSSAALTGDEGFVIFADAELGTTFEMDLTADEALWVRCTEAGDLRVLTY